MTPVQALQASKYRTLLMLNTASQCLVHCARFAQLNTAGVWGQPGMPSISAKDWKMMGEDRDFSFPREKLKIFETKSLIKCLDTGGGGRKNWMLCTQKRYILWIQISKRTVV